MDDEHTYSVYEAKAKFSQVVRTVRSGNVVIVTYRGEPVAEIRPFREPEGSVERRLSRLGASGVLWRAEGAKPQLEPVEARAGALSRFLEERD
jgi:prevent-host-death family protein